MRYPNPPTMKATAMADALAIVFEMGWKICAIERFA
jgi:hypothetical protein